MDTSTRKGAKQKSRSVICLHSPSPHWSTSRSSSNSPAEGTGASKSQILCWTLAMRRKQMTFPEAAFGRTSVLAATARPFRARRESHNGVRQTAAIAFTSMPPQQRRRCASLGRAPLSAWFAQLSPCSSMRSASAPNASNNAACIQHRCSEKVSNGKRPATPGTATHSDQGDGRLTLLMDEERWIGTIRMRDTIWIAVKPILPI